MRIFVVFISVLFLLGCVSALEQQAVFVLTLRYDKGNVSAQSLVVTQGYFSPPIDQPEEGYLLEVLSVDRRVLYSQRFDFNLEMSSAADPSWFDKQGRQVYIPAANETRFYLEKTSLELMLPYFRDASRIQIKDSLGNIVFSLVVNTDKPQVSEQNSLWQWIAGIGVVVIGVILFFIFRRKRLKS